MTIGGWTILLRPWGVFLIAEIVFLVHVARGVRGRISLLVWLLVAMPEARAAFLVEFQGERKPVQVHSVISVNPDGVVLRPTGGGFGNGVRHRWDEFTARSLGLLMSEFLKDPVFNQKPRDVKFQIMEAVETARRKKAPVVVAPLPKPVQPLSPAQPVLPVQPPQPMPVAKAPAPPAVNTNTGIPQPVGIAVPVPAPTNSLPPPPQPTSNAASASPASPFQLVEPPGVLPFPERRPPASALSPEVVFNPSGIFIALLVMALSGYAGYEIARFKKRPVKLVCALSAILPVVGPAVFLALPPQVASALAAPGVPGAAELPGTTPPTPLPAVRKMKYEDDPDSPYANLPAVGAEETQFAEEPAVAPVTVAQSLEHYHSSEYQFTPGFFSQYFAQFVGTAATTGEALILRTASTEYSVHYISSVDATGLQFIFASQGQWMEEFLSYADLTEVEVLGRA